MEPQTNTNTKIIWAVIALVAVSAGVYIFALPQKEPTASVVGEQTAPSRIAQGTVVGAYPDRLEVVVAVDSVEKIAKISQATKIEKVISQKNASGVVEKQALAEVNIGDVPKGTLVTIIYQSDTNNVLSGVGQITFVVEGNIDIYFKSQATNQSPYLKGQVVALDIAGRTLQYKPYFFNTLGTTTASVAIPDGISVYRIDDPARVSITYARTTATLTDIQPGQVIFILADPPALKAGKVVPQAFIISGK